MTAGEEMSVAAVIVDVLLEMRMPMVDAWIEPGMANDALTALQSILRKWKRQRHSQGCADAAYYFVHRLDQAGLRDRVHVLTGRYRSDQHHYLTPEQASTEPHFWLEIDGKIVDPTAGQFKDFPNMQRENYEGHRVA